MNFVTCSVGGAAAGASTGAGKATAEGDAGAGDVAEQAMPVAASKARTGVRQCGAGPRAKSPRSYLIEMDARAAGAGSSYLFVIAAKNAAASAW